MSDKNVGSSTMVIQSMCIPRPSTEGLFVKNIAEFYTTLLEGTLELGGRPDVITIDMSNSLKGGGGPCTIIY